METVFDYPLKIEIFFREEPQLEVTLLSWCEIKSKLLTSKLLIWIPRDIYPDKITMDNFDAFLETRVPDKTREDIDIILRNYDLKFFNPLQMCMKSHGRNMTDFLWMRFNDERMTFDDIKLRD